MTIIVRGLLDQLLVTRGYIGSTSIGIITHADPRQGTIIATDDDPAAVDPRQGTVLFSDG